MKKLFVSALVLATLSAPAFAAKKQPAMSDMQVKNLISRLEKKIEARKKKISKLDTKIVRFFLSPSQPKQNENVVVFAQIASRFLDSDTFLEATFDGNAVALEKSAAELWAYDAGAFSEIKDHTFTANVFVQDSAAAAEIKNAITALDAAIAGLNEQIDAEADENTRNQLIAERDGKISQRTNLIDALNGLRKSIASEALTFSIAENPTAPGFPRIQFITPKSGSVDGGATVLVNGENFESGMQAKLGGVSVALNVNSPTEAIFVTPAFSAEGGPKDLEIFTSGPNVKNTIRKNAFYAIPGLLGNSRPVAVPNPSLSIALGSVAYLNGLNSYDDNGQNLTYAWTLISAPVGSNYPIGVVYSTDAQFSITPNKPGHYVWQLVATEVGTNPALSSEPSLTVVTVNPPANTAPVPTASAISVGVSGTATRQVAHGDVDNYQAHSYRVIKQSAFGTASVSSTGLVSFTAGASVGSDSIDVLVMDNGNPPLSGVVNIPVSVVTSNIVMNDLYNYNTARDGFITVTMGADTLSTTAPGGIKSVVWDFGDGTSGASPYPYTNNGSVEHDYLVAGTYTAVATVTDAYGNTGSKSYTFSTGTSAMPVPHLVSSVYSGSAPLTVSFDATGSTDDVGIGQYRFRWADGTAETKNSTGLATHTFNAEGTYRVQLRTRDADQNVSFAYVDIYVGSSPLPEMSRPVPQMNITTKEVLVNTAHAFSAAGSYDPNPSGSIADYRWNFSDYYTCNSGHATPGCVDTGSSVTYTYSNANSYWVNLEVEGALGGVSTLAKQVLAVNSGHAPRAMPGRDKVEGVAPLTVNVDGSHSFDYDGTISSHQWSFGDPGCTVGCTISSATGSYTYANPGNYWVNLAVTDNDGNVHGNGYSVIVYPSAKVKAQVEKSVKAVKAKRAETKEVDFERERQKNFYAELCSKGSGVACYNAGRMYEEDGDTYAAGNFYTMACSLGYSAACSVKK